MNLHDLTDADPGVLEVQLLGAPSWGPPGQRSPIADPRGAVLIAMIAIDGPLPRARAAETFWPQSEGKARTNLRVLLHRLQQAAGTRLFAPGDRLALLPHLRVDLAEADDTMVARGLQLGPSHLLLLDGVDMGDLPEASRWLSQARLQMEQRVVRGHVAWLDTHRDPAHLPQAASVAESLVAINPLGEIGYRELMRVRAERGDRAGALAAFEQCRHELKEHLGTSPDPQTAALHRAILRARGDTGLDAPARRPLLQREQELADMDKALATRRVVIVEGPSGVGKTALLRQFARQRGDFYWAIEASDGGQPLAGIVRLVAHLAQTLVPPGSESPLPKALEALRNLQRLSPDEIAANELPALADGTAVVAGLLQQAGHRGVVLDDIHLLDDASLDVLALVLHTSWERLPWCDFVLAYRPMRARRKVRALCEKLALDGRLRLVHPRGLRRDAVLALMGAPETPAPADAAAADRLLAMSGGTPAVLVELIESLTELPADDRLPTLPPQIRSILLERLRSCSSSADGLAQLASVAGPSFSVGLAAAITGLSSWKVAEKWNELLLAGVFDAHGFAFPLVELAVRESVPDAVRQFMHGEVAKALEREGAAAERLAFHWQQAGDAQRAARFGRAAAAAGLQAGQLDAAIEALERVVFLPNGACAEGDTTALLQLATLYLDAGRLDQITEVLEAAARSPANPLERGVCTALGARTLLAMGGHASAETALLSALPLLETAPSLHRAVAGWAAVAAHRAGTPARVEADVDALVADALWSAEALQVHTPRDARRCVTALMERVGADPGGRIL